MMFVFYIYIYIIFINIFLNRHAFRWCLDHPFDRGISCCWRSVGPFVFSFWRRGELGRPGKWNSWAASLQFPMGNREIIIQIFHSQIELPSRTQSGYDTTALNDFNKWYTIGPAVGLIKDLSSLSCGTLALAAMGRFQLLISEIWCCHGLCLLVGTSSNPSLPNMFWSSFLGLLYILFVFVVGVIPLTPLTLSRSSFSNHNFHQNVALH